VYPALNNLKRELINERERMSAKGIPSEESTPKGFSGVFQEAKEKH